MLTFRFPTNLTEDPFSLFQKQKKNMLEIVIPGKLLNHRKFEDLNFIVMYSILSLEIYSQNTTLGLTTWIAQPSQWDIIETSCYGV